jgi:hypothetical protein
MFLCLLIQFLEDLSDRELEKFVSENNTSKWFCQFGLTDKEPVVNLTSQKIQTKKI